MMQEKNISQSKLHQVLIMFASLLVLLTHPGVLTFFANTIWVGLLVIILAWISWNHSVPRLYPAFALTALWCIIVLIGLIRGSDSDSFDILWLFQIFNVIVGVLAYVVIGWAGFIRGFKYVIVTSIFCTLVALFWNEMNLPFRLLRFDDPGHILVFPFNVQNPDIRGIEGYGRYLVIAGKAIHFVRVSSLFYEPGAFSIYLIMGWHLVENFGFGAKASVVLKIGIILSLLLSGSMGGMMVFVGYLGVKAIVGNNARMVTRVSSFILFLGLLGFLSRSEGNFTIQERVENGSFEDRETKTNNMLQRLIDDPFIPLIDKNSTGISTWGAFIGNQKIFGILFIIALVAFGIRKDPPLLWIIIGSGVHQPILASIVFWFVVAHLFAPKDRATVSGYSIGINQRW